MGNDKKVMIRDLVNFFQLEQIAGDDASLNRWVVVPDINRPGLELAGYEKMTEPRRIVIFGNREREYISTLSEEVQRERFMKITDALTPCVLLTHNRECPKVLEEVAKEQNFPVLRCRANTTRAMVEIISYLDEKLAESDTIHGVLINVAGIGVLILGESGMGKSEIALELIHKGHSLVADDRVDVSKIHNEIIGTSSDLLEGFLEIRGVGIIDVIKMFGASALLPKSKIDMVIRLEAYNPNMDYSRVSNEDNITTDILGVLIPTMVIPVKEGRLMSVIVESAVTNFRLKERGYNSMREFEQRVYDFIEKENEKRGM